MVPGKSFYCSAEVRVNPEIQKISSNFIEAIKTASLFWTTSKACVIHIQLLFFTGTLCKNTKNESKYAKCETTA